MSLCIFDLGNVVLDNVEVSAAIAEVLNVSLSSFRGFYREHEGELMTGSLDQVRFWELYRKQSGLCVEEDLLESCFRPTKVKSIFDLIERLKSCGHRVVCGSNTYESHYRVMTRSGVLEIFDQVYASHLMRVAKPDPAFYEHIMEAEGYDSKEVFFTDDLQENIDAALSLGIHAHRYTDPRSLEDYLLAHLVLEAPGLCHP